MDASLVPPGMLEADLLGSKLLVYAGHSTQCSYLLNNNLEDGVIAYFRKAVLEGDVVADIGAHVGLYTCLFSRLVGTDGHVFAFEPETQHATALALNVARNQLANVTVCPAACGGETKHVQFPEGGCGDQRPGAGNLKAWQVRLDDVLEHLDGFKMDTQGGEVEILGGMARLLAGVRFCAIESHGDTGFATVATGAGLVRVGDFNNQQLFFERPHV